MTEEVLAEIVEQLPEETQEVHTHLGDETIVIESDALLSTIEALQEELGFDVLGDLSATVSTEAPGCHEVIYHLRSTGRAEKAEMPWKRVRLKVLLAEEQSLPSVASFFPAAIWYEREIWEMFGVSVESHKDLRRLLTHWEFEGHPLQKDFDVTVTQPLSKAAPPSWFGFEPDVEVVDFGPNSLVTAGGCRVIATTHEDVITRSAVEIGYLHRGLEKAAEHTTWGRVFPLIERLNGLAAPAYSIGYAMAVEKLAQIEVPERARWLRMIICELSRIAAHCACIQDVLVEISAHAFTAAYARVRETIRQIFGRLFGHRVMDASVRIGGFSEEPYYQFADECLALRPWAEAELEPVMHVLERDQIFLSRTVGVGVINADDAVVWGVSGPNARASGLPFDIRSTSPYAFYDRIGFEFVLGSAGDVHDRVMVRWHEIRQSLLLIERCVPRFMQAEGEPLMAEVPGITPPLLKKVYADLEARAQHVALWTEGEQISAGEVYGYSECPGGELGFYLVSDGAGRPHRCRISTPSFAVMQCFASSLEGLSLEDIALYLRSLQIVPTALDR